MTQMSLMNSTPSTTYRITNPERFRAAARASESACPNEPDEMTAIRLTTEIILEYTGETTDTLLKKSGESLETAALWDEAGYEPPHDIQILIEILHRIHAGN